MHRHEVLRVTAVVATIALLAVSARVRQLFDLDAEPEKIASHLESAGFGPIRGAERGVRVPGAADGFELAVRAILGQQVSVKGATTLMSRRLHSGGRNIVRSMKEMRACSPRRQLGMTPSFSTS